MGGERRAQRSSIGRCGIYLESVEVAGLNLLESTLQPYLNRIYDQNASKNLWASLVATAEPDACP